jgi:hypothetical protein
VIADSGKNLRTDGKAGKVLISHWQYKSFINKSNKISKTSPGSPLIFQMFRRSRVMDGKSQNSRT